MRIPRWLFDRTADAARFEIGSSEIDPALFGLTAYATTTTPEPRISRREAIQVPAVKRTRDLIAGTLGSLPLSLHDADRNAVQAITSALLDQPERNVPRSVTMARTFEDMLFEGVAWWRIVEFGWHGYPTKVARLDPRSVMVQQDARVYVRPDGASQGTAWEYVEDANLIRFDSPNDALLDAGARAIRTCLKLDAAAARYADEPMPTGYFAPAEGADPAEDDEITEILDKWKTARQTRGTAYVPAALKYQATQMSAADIQLAEARQHAVLEIARVGGVDPEDLGVSTTSRTYANAETRRRDLIDFTLSGYVAAVQDRLSMGDVTPRGYYAKVNFDGFLRSDTKTRYEAYQIGLDVGAVTMPEIRALEDRPALKPSEVPVPKPAPAPAADPALQAAVEEALTFEDIEVVTFEDVGTDATFTVDIETRTIRGLAVPYGQVASSGGRKWSFSKGSLTFKDVGRVKLLMQHDFSQAVGKATALEDTDAGLFATFKVARGDAGDRALILAEDGVFDGLSIGVAKGGRVQERAGVFHAVAVPMAEISLTPSPAFDDARVLQVTASNERTPTVETDTDTTAEVDGAPVDAPVTFTQESLQEAIRAHLDTLVPEPREVVSAGAALQVTEPLPYTFDRGGNLIKGQFDFSTDLITGLQDGNREALDRALGFMQATFDVDTADVTSLNPNRQRPDLYVDQRQYRFPLWEAVRKGTLTDKTPFVLPKFNTSSGLVAPHTEGVEPTPGAAAVTSQTVTPGAVSGKVEITREVWDQGGNPQASTIIFRQMERAYYEALEAKVVATLDAVTPTGITITTAAVDAALSNGLAAAFAALQYVRGGFAFDTFAVQIDLYTALAKAVDDAGRPLFPILNPSNANGTASPRFSKMNVHGVDAFPEWALAATGVVAASSYLFDRESVFAAASAPQRLEFQYRVAYVDLAIWGYSVGAVLDLAGVREVIYDPA